jgi:hypothetical protein
MIVYSVVVYSCLCPWVFYWIKEKSIFVRRRGNLQYEKDIPDKQDRLQAMLGSWNGCSRCSKMGCSNSKDGLHDEQDSQKEKQDELQDEQDRLEVQSPQ